MDRRNEDTALLALRGGLRGRFRRSFDSMENAFEVLQDRLQHAVNPAERAELMPLLEELQTQLICLRRLGDQASDAATAALLHGTCVPQPIDLLGQLREFCSILQEEAAQYALPFTVTLQADGLDVLPTTGDVSLLNGLLTNLVSNTLAADRAAHYAALHAGSALLQGQRPGSAARCRRPADRGAMERTPAPRGRAGPAAGCRLHKRHGLGADRRGGAGYELAVHAARRAAARRHGADLAHRASR